MPILWCTMVYPCSGQTAVDRSRVGSNPFGGSQTVMVNLYRVQFVSIIGYFILHIGFSENGGCRSLAPKISV